MSVLNVALRTALRTSANAVASTSSAGVHTSANLDMPQSARRNPNRTSKDGKIPVTMIPGDGVGPEIMEATMDLIKHIGAPVTFEVMQLSEINRIFSAPVEKVIESVARNKIALKGVIAVPETGRDGELESINQTFRKSLDLYANVVKCQTLASQFGCRSLDGVGTRHEGIDMVIIREQTEGEYSALEHESTPGVVECLKVVTAEKSLRIAKFAFDYATRFGRKKVTCVHKANIMKQGDGLFMKCCEDISKMYPNIEFEKMIVDNTTMQLVSKPQQFDVMVMPNLYGNIIDNLGAGLVGGAGVVAGASYSADVAVFETGAHHTFDEGVGKNVANPTAMFLAAAKMLEHVGCDEYSKTIKGGVEKVLTEGKVKTRDLKGFSTTNDFTSAVISAI